MRYSLIFHAPEPGVDGPAPTEEDFQEMMRLIDDFGQALTSAGVFVAWEMLSTPLRDEDRDPEDRSRSSSRMGPSPRRKRLWPGSSSSTFPTSRRP